MECTEPSLDPRLERVQHVYRSEGYLANYHKSFGADVAEEPGIFLDLGAGDARFAAQVAEWDNKHATVIALDPGFFFRPPGVQNIITEAPAVAALGQELPLKTESVDRAVSRIVFGHLSRTDAICIIQEALRVLRPRGTFHINPALHGITRRFGLPDGVSYAPHRKTLQIIKPADYQEWSADDKQAHSRAVAKRVSSPQPVHLVQRAVWRAIKTKRLNRYE